MITHQLISLNNFLIYYLFIIIKAVYQLLNHSYKMLIALLIIIIYHQILLSHFIFHK